MKNAKLLISIILISIFLCGCNTQNKPYVFAGTYFDTYISITIYDKCPDNINEHLDILCNDYDLMFSTDNEDSYVYKINHSNGAPVECSDEFITVLNRAIDFSKEYDKTLDPTIETISCLYNFTNQESDIPSIKQINQYLQYVDYNNITISGNYVTLTPNTKINLGYMAKGYIADGIKAYLIENNIDDAIINLGGNILTMGSKNNKPFTVGIKKPFSDNVVCYAINSTNESVVTSGIYERYCTNNNTLYHHIIDISTGYPVNNHVYSVTITGESSEICDLYSTLLLIKGPEEGLSIIENLHGYEALFIMDDYSFIKSSGFKEDIHN